MLSHTQRIAFLAFATIMTALGARSCYRLYRRIVRGRKDTDARSDRIAQRLWYALGTSLTQSRTFRKRPAISFFHALIFYGFVFYLLVNVVDATEGFIRFAITSSSVAGKVYNLSADILSLLVLVGVVALVLRRFLLPSRRDFRFNRRTLLHPDVKNGYVWFDSLVVSSFILFHVGSRAVGAGARLAAEGPDRFQPFATLLSHAFTPANAERWRVLGYWGALGSVLAFLVYFPRSKHIHIFMAPAKYFFARRPPSGVLPTVELNLDSEDPQLGASRLEDLSWPRLLDAYACIQCNRCQDVCPATATGKSLSPSALEVNKRMELNKMSRRSSGFGSGAPSPDPLLTFALSPEAAWACTTCGACIEVCPVGDEPMLDIIDIRRQQVMVEGAFPAQLQSAFRGMERSNNPWGIRHEKRLDWADGLNVKTTDESPDPDVLFWVGCAASYDPQAQKTARAFVQLLDHAKVNFAVLGKKECCTGDSARRAGNEYLYRQLADRNVATLNALKPKLIVATCPHCMNAIGKEYGQLGGEYKVIHHTEFLASLVAEGKLEPVASRSTVAFHDPCYLGRHNGVYDAPRNLLNVLSTSVVELDRNRENSFCCGAGGAQFWKEEELGEQRISGNRYDEVQRRLAGAENKVLAVGCPFCKSMLESTPEKGTDPVAVRDIAELLLEGVQKKTGQSARDAFTAEAQPSIELMAASLAGLDGIDPESSVVSGTRSRPVQPPPIPNLPDGLVPSESESIRDTERGERKKWVPKKPPGNKAPSASVAEGSQITETVPPADENQPDQASVAETRIAGDAITVAPAEHAKRKVWTPKRSFLGAAPPEAPERLNSQKSLNETSAESGRLKKSAETKTVKPCDTLNVPALAVGASEEVDVSTSVTGLADAVTSSWAELPKRKLWMPKRSASQAASSANQASATFAEELKDS